MSAAEIPVGAANDDAFAAPQHPAALALALLDEAARRPGGLVYVAGGERRAEEIAALAARLAPERPVLHWPAWDSLPFDLAPPSAGVMGRRAAAMARIAEGMDHPLIVTSADALLQRTPPPAAWSGARLTLRTGEAIDPQALTGELAGRGYWLDERIDEPGEMGVRGGVIDIFPADADAPVRLDHEDGRILEIRRFDAVSQRTLDALQAVTIVPATEDFQRPDQATEVGAGPAAARASMAERVVTAHADLAAPADLFGAAALALSGDADRQARRFLELVADGQARGGASLYLGEADWDALASRPGAMTESPAQGDSAVASFATQRLPAESAGRFLRKERDAGRTIVLAAPTRPWLRRLRRLAEQALDAGAVAAESWADVRAAQPGSLVTLLLPIDAGFRAPEGVTALAAGDVFGSRARAGAQASAAASVLAGPDLRCGDVVVHRDHGLAVLEDVETVETPDAGATETIRLRFAGDEVLMVPADEADRLWRYGSEPDTVTLDRLGGSAWEKRRAEIEAEIADAAERLARLARERDGRTAAVLAPPQAAYERFAARFPFGETPDQSRAIADALADLASGKPMDRLVCGDVGFGKTEVALRAAAAAALAGKQVAVAAPTTVLARQHYDTFRKRFAGLGVEVAALSRFVSAADARAVKAGLADGSIRIAIGTHALAAKDVRFADLGLLIIDEEQRFGARHKQALAALGVDAHVMTLTATPIPRTLQAAMAGLRSLSVIATPPAARVPVRAVIQPFDDVLVRDALLRERRRGGQSFVVCPRVEDIEPMRARLAALWPEAKLLVAHGRMKPADIDDALIRFADGDGDVLLATNIVESGLDIPNANTMVVWRPDRFGLAQLHQLRGRVGRGRRRGVFILAADPAAALSAAARKRLETLAALDRLGAGFAISARDLDQRGAGDLLGEDQSGHMKLIGPALYQDMLERAIAAARGESVPEDWTPELRMAEAGVIPASYIPEADVRLELYVRFARARSALEIEQLAEEIEDRFGEPPEPVVQLIDRASIAMSCRALDVARLDVGPNAVAATFRGDGQDPPPWLAGFVERAGAAGLAWKDGRLVWAKPSPDRAAERAHARKLLERLADVQSANA
ncbi:DEAD/DEAH box helicase [Alsobacter sp. SYSU BS001988]